jgi:hypothetical protein
VRQVEHGEEEMVEQIVSLGQENGIGIMIWTDDEKTFHELVWPLSHNGIGPIYAFPNGGTRRWVQRCETFKWNKPAPAPGRGPPRVLFGNSVMLENKYVSSVEMIVLIPVNRTPAVLMERVDWISRLSKPVFVLLGPEDTELVREIKQAFDPR